MKIRMKHPATKELREVAVGWDWVAFWSPLILAGVPLLLRKLNTMGWLVVGLWVVQFATMAIWMDSSSEGADMIYTVAILVELGLSVFLGVKGGELTGKNYLGLGYEFGEADGDLVKLAKARWGIVSE